MILTKFEAKLDLPHGATALEVYDAAAGQSPPDDFIISRRRDGTVASRYGDLSWDISAWHTEGRLTVMYFDFWSAGPLSAARDRLSRDARWLLFALIWLRDGAPLCVGTLVNYIRLTCALALYADDVSCRVLELLSDEKRLRAFADTRCAGSMTAMLGGLLSHLVRIGEPLLGFGVVGDKLRKVLNARSRAYAAGLLQHPPIPTRIYSKILSCLAEELAEWEQVAPECLALLRDCGKNPCYGRKNDTQQKIAKRRGRAWTRRPEWAELASPGVRAYLRGKGLADTLTGLASIVLEIQLVAKLVIQAFSGMRDDEALTLPYDCPDTTVSGSRTHRLMQGLTTKLAKGIKRTRWVTNKEGHRAIELAQQIAAVIYDACDASGGTEIKAETRTNGRPLFVSPAYLGFAGKSRKPPTDGHFFTGTLPLNAFDRLRARLQPIIEDPDLIELEQIDEHRAWRSEDKFQVGSPWRLTTHQLRRSLAVYAQRSGLVTLPSLRQQLQHITDEMSRYYSRGSQYAKDIFGDDTPDRDHFSLEWQSAQVESEAISYTLNVLLNDAQLFGGHAAFVTHRLQGGDGIVAAETRAETVRMFKKGQLHYREILIGGCTRSDECDSPALDWLNVECISNNCSNMVGNLTKLELVVAEQERLVQSIPPTSLLYKTENSNLVALVSARDKARLEKKGATK